MPDNGQRPYYRAIIALLGGVLIPFSLAPFECWYLSLPALAALLWVLLSVDSPKQAALYGWLFGCSQFGIGVSWVYISIHYQSQTPAILAVPMTIIWCAGLALFSALFAYAAYLLLRRTAQDLSLLSVLALAALWTLLDWVRSFFLSGFPWLFIGHAQVDGPLAAWLAIGGTYLCTFILAATAFSLSYFYRIFTKHRQRQGIAAICLFCILSSAWLYPTLYPHKAWTQATGQSTSVNIVQANIPQQIKWNPLYREQILMRYFQVFDQVAANHLYIFPETALPVYQHELQDRLNDIGQQLAKYNSGLLTGIASQHGRHTFNSIISQGEAKGVYHKNHLVPFGEYVPFHWLRELGNFFNLPMSMFSPGPTKQALFSFGGANIAASICYEIAFPYLIRDGARNADFLLTVSNDTWFGRSWAPAQHMQIAQSRAAENGRYLVRSTNNGMTAIVDNLGRIKHRLPSFTQGILHSSVPHHTGQTPYARTGDWPFLLFYLACLILACIRARSGYT